MIIGRTAVYWDGTPISSLISVWSSQDCEKPMGQVPKPMLLSLIHISRLRVERVKELLLNPHKRVSEAAFEAGFQSLSQFNRVFRRVAGEAPSTYRCLLYTSD